jgi:glycosyltransferase involved in cell wall biosynthesis
MRLPGDKFNIYKQEKGFKKIKEYIQNNVIGIIAFKLARNIIVLGEYLKKELISRGIKETKINNIYQPINVEQFSRVDKNDRYKKNLALPHNKKVILYVGRLTYEKGADRLLKIIQEVLKRKDDVFFLIIGDGPYKGRFEKINGHLTIIDSVPIQEIDQYYKAADLFLFPSRREGVPNVVLEAISCGLPVISSRVGELPYLLPFTLKDSDDFINYILNEDWHKARANGLSKKFNWEHLKKQYTNLLVRSI